MMPASTSPCRNALIGQSGRLATGGWTTRDYAFYLALMDRLPKRLNARDATDSWTTDAVELGVFEPPANAAERAMSSSVSSAEFAQRSDPG